MRRIVAFLLIAIPLPAASQSLPLLTGSYQSPSLGGSNNQNFSDFSQITSSPAYVPVYLAERGNLTPGGALTTTVSPTGLFLDIGQALLSTSNDTTALNQRLSLMAFEMRRDFQRLSEGIALSSALTVLPPNPGDRFAVTVSGSGYESQGAGSISLSYRPTEDVLLFGAFARSSTQNLVKGGASFSFK